MSKEQEISKGFIVNSCGLSERSWGNGLKKNTVIHYIIQRPLKLDRLERQDGDLLCKKRGRKKWFNIQIVQDDEKITCNCCLKLEKKLLPQPPASEGKHE